MTVFKQNGLLFYGMVKVTLFSVLLLSSGSLIHHLSMFWAVGGKMLRIDLVSPNNKGNFIVFSVLSY